ncbi:hypothetical protein HYC85_018906 [Camellia sinensis]|uniref:ATPase AAA-type core domain-containing protein n=1 Tax=Camellia sinensis TaxID=4442 RepID=A0A7J7GVN7_CAMSI|nr:hypothetical protein HYC85_018906 [Camellia sinensis]
MFVHCSCQVIHLGATLMTWKRIGLNLLLASGSVVVIGATNRPDAVDPALRRPGRFVREIYFPLPSVEDRAAILSLHTQSWPKPVTGSVLNWIPRRTVGFAGADLQALCTQAAIIALRRNCPLQEILSVAEKKASHGKRPLPTFAVEERDWLESLACAPPLSSQRGAGMAANDVVSSPLCSHLIPCLRQPLSRLLVSLYLDERLLLPPHLYKAATLVKSVIVSALDKEKVPSDHWWFRVHDLLQETDVLREIEINLSRGGILIGQASDSNFDDWGEGTNDDSLKYKYPKDQQIGTRPSLLQNIYYASANKLGFRMLISGSPRSGQRYLASCLLHCFVGIGNMEIQKVDLATISQEGHRDVTQGVTRILASVKPSALISGVLNFDLIGFTVLLVSVKSVYPSEQLVLWEQHRAQIWTIVIHTRFWAVSGLNWCPEVNLSPIFGGGSWALQIGSLAEVGSWSVLSVKNATYAPNANMVVNVTFARQFFHFQCIQSVAEGVKA